MRHKLTIFQIIRSIFLPGAFEPFYRLKRNDDEFAVHFDKTRFYGSVV